MNGKPSLLDHKVDTKLILMSAWVALMCLYLYCDIFSLYKPGQLESISGGTMGFVEVSQTSLFLASLLMVIPSLMIPLSVLATAKVSRIINVLASATYFLVNIGNLLGETWGYYYLFGLLEVGLVLFIFITSLRWPKHLG